MEKENALQLNTQKRLLGYCFQDFTKAFRKNWNFKKKKNQYIVSLIREAGIDKWIMVAYLMNFTLVCLNLVH